MRPLFLLMFLLTTKSSGNDISCDWKKFGDFYYKMFQEEKSWLEADQACKGEGGELTSVPSKEVDKFLSGYKGPFWIGGDDFEEPGTFKWKDGTDFVYQNWVGGKPKKDGGNCISKSSKGWLVKSCGETQTFVCHLS